MTKVKDLIKNRKERSDKGGHHNRRGYVPGTKVSFKNGKISSVNTPPKSRNSLPKYKSHNKLKRSDFYGY